MVALSTLGGSGGGSGGTPKVFFNGTLTSTDLTGNDTFTLFTNDATTTSVIEAVTVDETVGPFLLDGTLAAGSFINDNIDVAKVVDLAGSEITAPSTSLTIKLDKPLVLKNCEYEADGFQNVAAYNSTFVMTHTESDILVNGKNTYSLKNTDEELIVKYFDATYDGLKESLDNAQVVPTMSYPAWYYETGNNAYYFLYNGNDQTKLFHAVITDGTLGSWTNVNQSAYSYKALDIENKKVFYTHASEMYQHDLVTNTETQLGGSDIVPRSLSYSTAGAVNGVFFFCRSSSTLNRVEYYDTNDSSIGYFYVPTNFTISNQAHLGVCYNPDEDKYYLSIGYQGNSDVYSFNWSNKSVVYLGDESAVYPNSIASSMAILGSTNGEMFINSGTGDLQIIKFENDTATLQESIASIHNTVNPTNSGAWYQKKLGVKQTVTLEAADYAINIKCKVSGTEYKGE
jgi:hypothetical protein